MQSFFEHVEIVRQIRRIEFALDFSVATKQTAMRNSIPLRHEVRGEENGFAALGFKAQRVLKSLPPRRIEAVEGVGDVLALHGLEC